MPYNVAIQENPAYIRVDVTGQRTPGKEAEDGKRVWKKVADLCRAKGSCRILAVWKVPGHLPTLAAYDIGSCGEEIDWDRRFKLAVVEIYEECLKDSLFAETVAVNRGYVVKVFDNEQDAKVWLIK